MKELPAAVPCNTSLKLHVVKYKHMAEIEDVYISPMLSIYLKKMK